MTSNGDVAAGKDEAFDGVGRFVDVFLDDPSREGLTAALAQVPDAGARLVDYLESRFVRLEPMTSVENSDEWWMMLGILATVWSPEDKAAFLARVGLSVASPDAYRWLAGSIFHNAVPVAELEPWLLRAIEDGSDKEKINASHLAYHAFDGTPDYELSAAGKARLLKADPTVFG